jgi:hypothetical protein
MTEAEPKSICDACQDKPCESIYNEDGECWLTLEQMQQLAKLGYKTEVVLFETQSEEGGANGT